MGAGASNEITSGGDMGNQPCRERGWKGLFTLYKYSSEIAMTYFMCKVFHVSYLRYLGGTNAKIHFDSLVHVDFPICLRGSAGQRKTAEKWMVMGWEL